VYSISFLGYRIYLRFFVELRACLLRLILIFNDTVLLSVVISLLYGRNNSKRVDEKIVS
jgi:hypothetical protein